MFLCTPNTTFPTPQLFHSAHLQRYSATDRPPFPANICCFPHPAPPKLLSASPPITAHRPSTTALSGNHSPSNITSSPIVTTSLNTRSHRCHRESISQQSHHPILSIHQVESSLNTHSAASRRTSPAMATIPKSTNPLDSLQLLLNDAVRHPPNRSPYTLTVS